MGDTDIARAQSRNPRPHRAQPGLSLSKQTRSAARHPPIDHTRWHKIKALFFVGAALRPTCSRCSRLLGTPPLACYQGKLSLALPRRGQKLQFLLRAPERHPRRAAAESDRACLATRSLQLLGRCAAVTCGSKPRHPGLHFAATHTPAGGPGGKHAVLRPIETASPQQGGHGIVIFRINNKHAGGCASMLQPQPPAGPKSTMF